IHDSVKSVALSSNPFPRRGYPIRFGAMSPLPGISNAYRIAVSDQELHRHLNIRPRLKLLREILHELLVPHRGIAGKVDGVLGGQDLSGQGGILRVPHVRDKAANNTLVLFSRHWVSSLMTKSSLLQNGVELRLLLLAAK